MKVYDAMAKAFAAEGTTDVFGMTGDSNIYWLSALERLGTRFYQVRHEGAGLAMADGWARMTGRPGVCTTTGGPGAAQLATTMIVASRARTPLVAFCGDTPTGDQENAQWLDQKAFAEGIEAGFVRVHSAAEVYAATQRAFYLARTESRPVMLNVPAELIQQDVDDDESYVASHELLARRRPVHPHPDAVADAVAAVAASSHPVLLVGRGAIFAGAEAQVRELADRIGAVVATTLMAKNWLGDHPYHVGLSGLFATRTAMELFADADCVIAVGASLNQYTTEHGYLYPDATFVQLDPRQHALMAGQRAADHYVQADAALGLAAINAALADQGVKNDGYHTVEVREKLTRALVDPREYDIPSGTVDPRDAVRTLDEAIPEDVGMVLGGGHQNHFGIMLANRQRSWLLPNLHFACLGQGLTTAMGASIAMGTPAYLMEGDGGFMMHLAEFETAVRYRIPVMVNVFNDEGFGAELHHYRGKPHVSMDMIAIPSPDLGAVGRALGGRGALVRTAEELRAAALDFARDPAPTLVDVRVANTVTSIPNRRRYLGEEDQ
jgi:thiamine pyrophosphate-dependent acetolactate synthase large subunit-like protein